jgi:single-strand DNA-binding protein
MLNKCQLIGNVGGDPDVRYTQNGKAVASLSLATTEKWKDANGNLQEDTEWHKLIIFGKTAEFVSEHVAKGARIYAEGKIKTRKWQGKDGSDHYTTEIICNNIILLSPFKKDSNRSTGTNGRDNSNGTQPTGNKGMEDDPVPF